MQQDVVLQLKSQWHHDLCVIFERCFLNQIYHYCGVPACVIVSVGYHGFHSPNSHLLGPFTSGFVCFLIDKSLTTVAPMFTNKLSLNTMAPSLNTMALSLNTMAPSLYTMAPLLNTMSPSLNNMAPLLNTMAPLNTMVIHQTTGLTMKFMRLKSIDPSVSLLWPNLLMFRLTSIAP